MINLTWTHDCNKWLNKIIQNPDNHFENVFITNFDLINNQCRGDKLTHDRKFYETFFKEKLNSEINDIEQKDRFVSAAINSERKDVYIEQEIYKDQFSRKLLTEKLNKNGVFLSNMRQTKYSNDCKSLPF